MRCMLSTTEPAVQFFRRAGYAYQKEEGGELAFTRRVGGASFPRYHVYVTDANGARAQLTINVHIDQKQPTYTAGKVHSGEYDGPLVEQELARLRQLVQGQEERNRASTDERAHPDTAPPKKGWFGRLFS
ncbi:hypothetical protein HYV74_00645 [Candidatus Uhrbacteria bacterium]|nr:hypothetical protein [Candidatus Uhrbacteria bacterium]